MSLSGEVFSGGATTSQHVEAQDDDHFENTTFKLKRTRSMGLLDEFIPEKLSQQQQENASLNPTNSAISSSSSSSSTSLSSSLSEDATTQHLEQGADSNAAEVNYLENNIQSNQSTSESPSPSPVASPTPSPALDLQSPELIPHDDTDLTVEPSRHVDYLSHQWDVSDIWKSWRYVISKRKDVANAARLENASWRTWAQRRSNLKTISPEVVNWSKDSDVTWLYGPILKDDDHINNENHESDSVETTATSSVAGDISIAKKCTPADAPKPILKRRTVEQLMISHSNLLKLQLATQLHQKKREQKLKQEEEMRREQQSKHADEYFDPEALLHKLNSQYKNISNTNNSSVARLQNLLKNSNSSSTSTLKQDAEQAVVVPSSEQISKEQEEESQPSSSSQMSKSERHIHFNDEVMQCIAIEEYSDDENEDDEYDSDEDYDDNYDYYDEDESSGNQLAQSQIYEGDDESIDDDDEDTDDEDDEDDDDEDDGGFFIKVRSNSNAPTISGQHSSVTSNENSIVPIRSESQQTEISVDSEALSTTSSKAYKTIQLLPSTSINYGSDESSDEENPYTSSLSHNVNNEISRGYDYYYDYNTVYTSNPHQALYGSYESPDVIDVPENLDMGSNFDYEFIENNETVPVIDTSSRINNLPISYSLPSSPIAQAVLPGKNITAYSPTFPIISDTPPSQASVKPSPFQMSDSEDDSESEDEVPGLSIGTRRSSQALAELVFNASLTSSKPETHQEPTPQHFPENHDAEPANDHISSINPRYSSTSISKQPTSSNSLSQLFFGAGGLTNADRELSKLFLGGLGVDDNNENKSNSFGMLPQREYTPSPDNTLSRSLSNTTKKSSPLPPHTTSENAFRGSGSPSKQESQVLQSHQQLQEQQQQPQQQQLLEPRRGGFLFDDDSEDSEDEGMMIGGSVNNRGQSYNTLSQVAGKNGIHSPSPTIGSNTAQQQQDDNEHKNLMGQAKGLAKHFFG